MRDDRDLLIFILCLVLFILILFTGILLNIVKIYWYLQI